MLQYFNLEILLTSELTGRREQRTLRRTLHVEKHSPAAPVQRGVGCVSLNAITFLFAIDGGLVKWAGFLIINVTTVVLVFSFGAGRRIPEKQTMGLAERFRPRQCIQTRLHRPRPNQYLPADDDVH